MTDEALKLAYRKLTAHASAEPINADALAALASGTLAMEQRDVHLAAVAESAQNVDLLRALHALAGDADALSAGVQRVRQPVKHVLKRPSRQHWWAVAASIALAGVVALALRAPVSSVETPAEQAQSEAMRSQASDGAAVMPEPTTTIMMASFENGATSDAAKSIFRGDFDS